MCEGAKKKKEERGGRERKRRKERNREIKFGIVYKSAQIPRLILARG